MLRYNSVRWEPESYYRRYWHSVPHNRLLKASKYRRWAGRVAMNLLISLMTITGCASWGYIVLFLDPDAPLAPIAFYCTLFVALTCTLAQLLSGGSKENGFDGSYSSAPSMGHAAAVTTIILFTLWLQSLRMLSLLNGILLASTFLLIEVGYYLSGKRRRPRARRHLKRSPITQASVHGEQ